MSYPTPIYDGGEPSTAASIIELYRNEVDDGEGSLAEDWFIDGGRYIDDHEPMIASFGDVLVSRNVKSADVPDSFANWGDSFALVRGRARYGIVVFGWGSCSGCDALQSCKSWEEVAEVRDEIARGVRWFESAADALAYVDGHDWTRDWVWTQVNWPRKLHRNNSVTSARKIHFSGKRGLSFLEEMRGVLVEESAGKGGRAGG